MKPKSLLRRITPVIEKLCLVGRQEPLVVAVSGGPDSVCLLHALVQLKDTLGLDLHVAHLNHSLRGAESDDDAQYVSDLARVWGIPATIEKRDVQSLRYRGSLEEGARQVRYTFLAEVAAAIGASRAAVGHTADDQIETILMHLVRGSGLFGLRGMQPITTWRSSPGSAQLTVVRPLLEITRRETEEYCRAHNLAPRTDSSNWSLAYLRNRFRSELIPLLQSYNPNIGAALLRTASAVADELAFLEGQVSQAWGAVVSEQPDGMVLDKEALSGLPSAIKRHLLRLVLERLLGDLTEVESSHIESMMKALAKPVGKRLSLPGGLVFSVGYTTCTVGPGAAMECSPPAFDGEHQLKVPGETTLPGWRVTASIFERLPGENNPQGFRGYFDYDVVGCDLMVRGRRPGDRFQPLGMNQPKKLQDFMVNSRIPRTWRDGVPIVCSPQQILWVVGWRIDGRAKVSDSTRHVLSLEFERI